MLPESGTCLSVNCFISCYPHNWREMTEALHDVMDIMSAMSYDVELLKNHLDLSV